MLSDLSMSSYADCAFRKSEGRTQRAAISLVAIAVTIGSVSAGGFLVWTPLFREMTNLSQ